MSLKRMFLSFVGELPFSLAMPLDGDFTDLSGNNYDITPYNSPVFQAGEGLNFDRSKQQYVKIDAAGTAQTLMPLDGSISWGCMVKFTTFISCGIMTRAKAGSNAMNGRYYLALENNNVEGLFQANGSTSGGFYSTGNLNTGQWYKMVSVYDRDANRVSLYIDGVEVGNAAANTVTGSVQNVTPLFLGVFNAQNEFDPLLAYLFNGNLKKAFVIQQALTPAQVPSVFDMF